MSLPRPLDPDTGPGCLCSSHAPPPLLTLAPHPSRTLLPLGALLHKLAISCQAGVLLDPAPRPCLPPSTFREGLAHSLPSTPGSHPSPALCLCLPGPWPLALWNPPPNPPSQRCPLPSLLNPGSCAKTLDQSSMCLKSQAPSPTFLSLLAHPSVAEGSCCPVGRSRS